MKPKQSQKIQIRNFIQCEHHENCSERGSGYVGSLKDARGVTDLWFAILKRLKPDAMKRELSTLRKVAD